MPQSAAFTGSPSVACTAATPSPRRGPCARPASCCQQLEMHVSSPRSCAPRVACSVLPRRTCARLCSRGTSGRRCARGSRWRLRWPRRSAPATRAAGRRRRSSARCARPAPASLQGVSHVDLRDALRLAKQRERVLRILTSSVQLLRAPGQLRDRRERRCSRLTVFWFLLLRGHDVHRSS